MDEHRQSSLDLPGDAPASDSHRDERPADPSDFDSKSGTLVYREKQIKPNKIYVGGLPDHTRPDDLQSCFGNIGGIVNIELKIGYGFVEFDTQEAADESIAKYNGGYFMGNKIRVQPCHGGGRFTKVADVEPGACFKCGQQGHWARECPNHVVSNHRGGPNAGSGPGDRRHNGPLPERMPPRERGPPPAHDVSPYRDDYVRDGPPREGRYYDYPPPRRHASPPRQYRDQPPPPPPPSRREPNDYYTRAPPPPRHDGPYYPPEDGRYPPPREYGRYPPPPPNDGRYPYPPRAAGGPVPPRGADDRGRDGVPPQGYRGRPVPSSQRYDYAPPGADPDGRYKRRSQSPVARTRTTPRSYDVYPPGGAPYAGGTAAGPPRAAPGREYASDGSGYHRP